MLHLVFDNGIVRRFKNCAPRRHEKFQNIVCSFNLCVFFFQMITKLLGQIVIKLFWPNYLIKEVLNICLGLGVP
jgi:hypothetical protein